MTKALERKLLESTSYEQWMKAAIAHDKHSGAKKWKQRDKSNHYDYKSIRRRLNKLQALRAANDYHGLLFTLNEGIHGNLDNMGRAELYQKAKFGTKKLICDYVDEVALCLDHLADPKIKGVSIEEKVDFFHRAHLCFGSSALLMSGAGTYLFFHVGVLKSLWEQNLIPEVISGASGGALVAALAGTRSHKDLGEIFSPEFINVEEELRPIAVKLSNINKSQIRRQDLEKVINKMIPDVTFEEAYKISGIMINISIAPAEQHQNSRLLNAITSPNVMVREAVLASTCVPGVFPAVTLAAKNVDDERVPYLPSRKWVDGSLSDDLPMKRLSRLYGVNHFIVSQTNPIVLPFISAEKKNDGLVSTISQTGLKTMKDWGLAVSHIIQKPLKSDSYFSKLINGYISVVSQTYTGDINILPSKRFLSPIKFLTARSGDEIKQLVRDGEKSTWPNIERIRIQTTISRTLGRLVKELDQSLLKRPQKKLKKSTTKKIRAVK